MLEIGKAKREANLLIGKYKKEPDLSFNNKSEQPHNTRAIIAESLGNKQDLLEIGKQKQIRKPMDFVLSKNDKTDPPHNTQRIIAESLGNKQDLLEIGRQREAMGGGDKKSAAAKSGLSKNDKPDPPHNTQKIIAESLGMSTGKVAQAEVVRTDLLSKNDKKLDPLKIGWQSSLRVC